MKKEIIHGTNSRYNLGCRCDACKDAHNKANNPNVILTESIASKPHWVFHGHGFNPLNQIKIK